jgi:hypothetical protein
MRADAGTEFGAVLGRHRRHETRHTVFKTVAFVRSAILPGAV